VRKCARIFGRYQCTPWLPSAVRAEVRVGLGVRNWVVEADHRYTDISASNDAVDAIIRTFHDEIYPKVNDGIKQSLASVNGRNLRTELEAKLGVPLPPEASVNVRITPEGVIFEATTL
jgi:hypothetical protein